MNNDTFEQHQQKMALKHLANVLGFLESQRANQSTIFEEEILHITKIPLFMEHKYIFRAKDLTLYIDIFYYKDNSVGPTILSCLSIPGVDRAFDMSSANFARILSSQTYSDALQTSFNLVDNQIRKTYSPNISRAGQHWHATRDYLATLIETERLETQIPTQANTTIRKNKI